MKKIIFLFLSFTSFIFAQTPQLLKDINIGLAAGIATASGSPLRNAVPHNSGLLFTANDGISTALWFSTGTTTGTNKIIPISTGTTVGAGFMTPFKGRVLFLNNNEIWITDATNVGTYKISSIPNLTVNTSFTVIANNAYFTATSAANGVELYKTDTVVGSTILLKDIWPGPPNSTPGTLVDDNAGGFYFTSNDGTTGNELWHSNGTTAGTNLVKDIVNGSGGSSVSIKAVTNNIVFFMANDGVNGSELWRSDGTLAGTYLLNQLTPGAGGSVIYGSTVYNNKFIYQFPAGIALQEADGTIANNTSYTISPTYTFQASSSSVAGYPFYKFNNDLYIFAFRKGPPANNIDSLILFKMTSTITNFTRVKAVKYTGVTNLFTGFGIMYMHGIYSNKFVVQEQNSVAGGNTFIISDGTTSGTIAFPSGPPFYFPECAYNVSFPTAGTFIPFISNNWIITGTSVSPIDSELHTIDYNTLAVNQIKNINPSSGFQGNFSSWSNFTILNNKVYFLANDGTTGMELWVTDGTNGGTNLLLDIFPGTVAGPFSGGTMQKSGNNLFFVANDGVTGHEVWVLNNAITGLEENKINNWSIVAFPNPFKNELKVNYILAYENNDATINLIEIASGKLLQKQTVNEKKGTLKFDTENLSSGIYLVSIQQKNHPNISLKVVNIK